MILIRDRLGSTEVGTDLKPELILNHFWNHILGTSFVYVCVFDLSKIYTFNQEYIVL